MSVNLSSSAPTLTLSSRRQPSSLNLPRPPYPRAYPTSSTSNLYSYLADLEYPEERKRSFDKSVRNQITFTESPTTAVGSSWTDVGGRPGKKARLGDYYDDDDKDARYPSQIGHYAAPSKPFGRSYVYPTSEERTNWWDDEEAEAEKDDSSDEGGDSTWDEVVEDQVQSSLIDPPRGRTVSPSPLGAVPVSRRSRSAGSPPPETPRYNLWNKGGEEEEERSSPYIVDSASTDWADEGFKAYFDLIDAGNSSSKDRHIRRRSKSLTPPTSPPKASACELFDHSVGEIEQGNTQAESSEYLMAQVELEEQEVNSMDVQFPSIYSPGTLSENNGSFDLGAAEAPAPFGLELYGAGRPPNPSLYNVVQNFEYPPQVPQFVPSFVYPCIPIEVGQGGDENGNDEVPDIISILNPEAFQEAPEGMEDDDLWKADYELMRRNLNAGDHIYRFFKRIGSQAPQERRHRNTPRPYSKLGFYPPLSAADLPRYLEQTAEQEEEAEDCRLSTSGSSSWSDLDGEEEDDYFKELPTFA